VLVNNAANDDRHPLDTVTPEYWDKAFAVNLRHQFFAAQEVRAHMRELSGGSIINFSSITWMFGGDGLIAYSSAKAAVIGLTNSLARELGDDNIRVNAIAPGAVVTERQLRLWYTEEQADRMAERQILKRRLLPDEVARTALFLASDDSRMITKQCIVVDAGLR
jgi:NAD(P)-dependent dehydrogenase (short-subunit alcohol dehydrogenase family)